MKRVLVLGVMVVALLSLPVFADTAQLTIRSVEGPGGNVFLLDNTTGETATTVQIALSESVALTGSDIIVFGGDAVAVVRTWGEGENSKASFDVEVPPHATVQISFTGDAANAEISRAWIYY